MSDRQEITAVVCASCLQPPEVGVVTEADGHISYRRWLCVNPECDVLTVAEGWYGREGELDIGIRSEQ